PLSTCIAPVVSELFPLSLHDALPILGYEISIQALQSFLTLAGFHVWKRGANFCVFHHGFQCEIMDSFQCNFCCFIHIHFLSLFSDRKSTRLNSSHVKISYAVFCLKKK